MRMLDRFLSTEYATVRADLGVYRILFCLLILAGLPEAPWLQDLPSLMFSPPISPVAWLSDFPPGSLYLALNGLIAISALTLLLGLFPRTSSITLALAMLSLRAFAYSSGKINHDILIVVIPMVLAFSTWGQVFRVSEFRNPTSASKLDDGFPISILAFLTAFWMATAGWQKITTDWLSPTYSVVYQNLFTNLHVTGRDSSAAEFALATFPNWVWECGDWITVIFEFSGLACVWKRKAFRYWLVAACFFHLGIDLLMLIPYSPSLIAYGAFAPWTQLRGLIPRPRAAYLAATACAMFCLSFCLSQWLPFLSLGRQIVWLAPILAVAFIGIRLRSRYADESPSYDTGADGEPTASGDAEASEASGT